MEHLDRLFPGGYQFLYEDTLFRPGTDSFLLSAFPSLNPGLRVCDLGCGTGLLGLLLLQRQPQLSVSGIELLPSAAELARRTAALNDLTDRLRIYCGDLRTPRQFLPPGSQDLVICNPPYYPAGSGRLPSDPALRSARSEENCTLEDVCQSAETLLRWGGRFCLVHKPERLTDVLCSLRAHRMEPKRLRFVCKEGGSAPSLFLLEGRRGGKPGLQIQPSLLLQTADGSPAAELDRIYFRIQEDLP